MLINLPAINLIFLIILGRYSILSFGVYPYQNSLMKEQLERSNSARFSDEFAYFVKCMIYTLRIESGLLLQEYLDTENTENKGN